LGLIYLIGYLPNDLEVLLYAVDSACSKVCPLEGFLSFYGIRNHQIEDYLSMKYFSKPSNCSTKVGILSVKVYYDFSLINYRRTADVKMIIRSCDGEVFYRHGRYSDKVPINRVKDVSVEGVSPDISQIVPSYFEAGVTALLVFGILYAFYTLEGR